MIPKNACAVILGTAFLLMITALAVPHALSWQAITPVSPGIGSALWNDRTYEALLQGMIVLAGVMSILLLLGLKQSGRMPP